MKLTAKGRYAVTAMLDLSMRQATGSITLADLAERQGISSSYLEQLFAHLRRADLVVSTRGPGGGYRLKKDPDEVSVFDVIHAVNETVDARKCGGKANCHDNNRCLTHDLWEELSTKIDDFLREVSLGQLMRRDAVQETAGKQQAIQVERQLYSV